MVLAYKKYKGVLSEQIAIKESLIGGGNAKFAGWEFYKDNGFFLAKNEEHVEKFKTFEELDMWVTETFKFNYY